MIAMRRPGMGALFMACALLLPAALRAQVTWVGTGPNSNFTTPANWQGGIVPPNTGADSATFTTPGTYTYSDITLNTNANLSGLTLQSLGSNDTYFDFYQAGGSTLTIGTGGISSGGANAGNGYFDVPIVLAGSQNWGSNGNQTIDVYGSGISGSGSLTLTGDVYLNSTLTFSGGITLVSGYMDIGVYGSNNTFGGGINVQSGTLSIDNYYGVPTPAGTGTITLADGAALYGYYANLSNAITLLGSVTLGSNSAFGTGLSLAGPITTTGSSTGIIVEYNSSVTVTGSVSGPASSTLTISGRGAQLPYDAGSQLVFEGALNQAAGVTVNHAALVLAPTGSVASAFPFLSPTGLQVLNGGYLGLDGTFTTPTSVTSFLTTYGPSLGAAIDGTLGFDSYNNVLSPGSTNTFSDPINLTNFSSSNFVGLGSSSAAVLTGTITPTSENTYPFGGGGGTLTVSSNLSDSSGTAVVVNAGPTPLTLILQGANGYTGGTTSNGGVLIFNSATPASGTITLNGGYVGYTENAANISTASDFIGQIQVTGNGGIIGFDSANVSSPRSTIVDPIDLSAYSSDNNPFIGTATEATLTGMITPAGNTYQFTGVKGGDLTIGSTLDDMGASAVIGLVTPIEAGGSNSVVNMTGTNTYAGGTVFNSGTLFINNDSALGSGPISVPDTNPYSGFVPYLAPFGADVTLSNAISIGSIGGGEGLQAGDFYSIRMLTLGGVISDYP
jgi:fibronectin-binding autotransporter adhesin